MKVNKSLYRTATEPPALHAEPLQESDHSNGVLMLASKNRKYPILAGYRICYIRAILDTLHAPYPTRTVNC